MEQDFSAIFKQVAHAMQSACSAAFPLEQHAYRTWYQSIRCLTTGSTYSLRREFTQQDVDAFVQLTGDNNPIHGADQQQQPSSNQQSSQAIVPGMLLASLFPAIIGTTFPGALYASQSLKFRRPAAVGLQVLAEVTVTGQSGSRVTFDTTIKGDSGSILVGGTALAIIKPRNPVTMVDSSSSTSSRQPT